LQSTQRSPFTPAHIGLLRCYSTARRDHFEKENDRGAFFGRVFNSRYVAEARGRASPAARHWATDGRLPPNHRYVISGIQVCGGDPTPNPAERPRPSHRHSRAQRGNPAPLRSSPVNSELRIPNCQNIGNMIK
jgi:hypothetical protein